MKAEEYLKEMSKEVHNRDVRDCIIQEYRDHLDDAIEALMEKWMSEAEAEEEAVRQMGDPEVAGRDMGHLYSKVLDYKMLFFFWGMGIFGCLAFWASSDSWDTEPISLGLFDGMPETIFHIFGLTLLMFGLFWSGVEKWVNVGTFPTRSSDHGHRTGRNEADCGQNLNLAESNRFRQKICLKHRQSM